MRREGEEGERWGEGQRATSTKTSKTSPVSLDTLTRTITQHSPPPHRPAASPPRRPTAPPSHRPTVPPPHHPTAPPPHRPTTQLDMLTRTIAILEQRVSLTEDRVAGLVQVQDIELERKEYMQSFPEGTDAVNAMGDDYFDPVVETAGPTVSRP